MRIEKIASSLSYIVTGTGGPLKKAQDIKIQEKATQTFSQIETRAAGKIQAFFGSRKDKTTKNAEKVFRESLPSNPKEKEKIAKEPPLGHLAALDKQRVAHMNLLADAPIDLSLMRDIKDSMEQLENGLINPSQLRNLIKNLGDLSPSDLHTRFDKAIDQQALTKGDKKILAKAKSGKATLEELQRPLIKYHISLIVAESKGQSASFDKDLRFSNFDKKEKFHGFSLVRAYEQDYHSHHPTLYQDFHDELL